MTNRDEPSGLRDSRAQRAGLGRSELIRGQGQMVMRPLVPPLPPALIQPRMTSLLSLNVSTSSKRTHRSPAAHTSATLSQALRMLLPGLASSVFSLASFFTLTCLGKSPVETHKPFWLAQPMTAAILPLVTRGELQACWDPMGNGARHSGGLSHQTPTSSTGCFQGTSPPSQAPSAAHITSHPELPQS